MILSLGNPKPFQDMTTEACLIVQLFIWTLAGQAPLSMGFPRQEYWSGIPFTFLNYCDLFCFGDHQVTLQSNQKDPERKGCPKPGFDYRRPGIQIPVTCRSIPTLNRTIDPSALKGTPLDNRRRKGLKMGNQGWRGDAFVSVNSPLARLKYTR